MIFIELTTVFNGEPINTSINLDAVTMYRESPPDEENPEEKTLVRLGDYMTCMVLMPYSEFDALFRAIHLGKNWVSEYNFAGHNIISDHDMEVNYRVAELLEIEENEGLDRNTSL